MPTSQWSNLPLVVTFDQAAQVFQLSRRTLTNMLDRGAQRRLKIGKEWRISQAELMRFVAGSVTPTHSPPSPTPSKGPVPLVESRWLLAVYVEVLSDSTEIVGK